MSLKTRLARLTELRAQRQRWKLVVLAGVIVYFILVNQVIHIRPDHIFVALVVLAFLLGRERAKRFLIDWLPFVLFWIFYDMMRGVADGFRGEINIVAPYRLDLEFFSWLTDGEVPPFWLQMVREGWSAGVQRFVTIVAANFYTLHFAAPLLLGWILWHTSDDRPMFYRFVYTLTILNVLALITFIVYPAAPPWYVYKYGFAQPDAQSSFWGISAGNLIDIDRMIGFALFTTVWDAFNANHFAAIPSLHGAYPIVIGVFAWKKYRKYGALLIAYPLITWFAAMYLNHHYVVDLVIGVLYIFVSYLGAVHLLYPLVFARFLERDAVAQVEEGAGKPPRKDGGRPRSINIES